MSRFGERIARAQEILRAEGLGGAVFAPSDEMRYLAGWAEGGHERLLALFLPSAGDPTLIVPAINAAQARQNTAGIADVRDWSDEGGWRGAVGALLDEWRLDGRGLAIDDELMAAHLLGIQELAPAVKYRTAGALMARLRAQKADDELDLMLRSGAITDTVYEECLPALREGMTELELQDVIRAGYGRRGTAPEFSIVGFGPNGALPHHHTGSRKLQRGDVIIIDIGCKLEGYCSDITRTVAFGEPEPEAHKVYDVVYRAHRAAFERVAPGVTGEQVDSAARAVITDAGYGELFIHRTGHGIGLSCHEPPYIVQGNSQPLQIGNCFSDEPGVYLEGRFGVRIENIVTVTETGARYLNADPPASLPVVH